MRNNQNRTDLPYLNDILNSIYLIETYFQEAPEKDLFIEERGLHQDAIMRNIEIIGEATKKMSTETKAKFSHIPWRGMSGMRDKLIHDYSEVDLEEVWKVASEDIPQLKILIEEALKTETNKNLSGYPSKESN